MPAEGAGGRWRVSSYGAPRSAGRGFSHDGSRCSAGSAPRTALERETDQHGRGEIGDRFDKPGAQVGPVLHQLVAQARARQEHLVGEDPDERQQDHPDDGVVPELRQALVPGDEVALTSQANDIPEADQHPGKRDPDGDVVLLDLIMEIV